MRTKGAVGQYLPTDRTSKHSSFDHLAQGVHYSQSEGAEGRVVAGLIQTTNIALFRHCFHHLCPFGTGL